MRGGAKRYHNALLDTIQQYMTFEQAIEAKTVLIKGGKKSCGDQGGRSGGRNNSHDGRGDRVCMVCNNTNDANVYFRSRVAKIIEHHFQPTPIVKKLLLHIEPMIHFGIMLIHVTYLLIPQMT